MCERVKAVMHLLEVKCGRGGFERKKVYFPPLSDHNVVRQVGVESVGTAGGTSSSRSAACRLVRIDEIVPFHSLEPAHLRKIIDLMVAQTQQSLQEQAITLQVTDEACCLLVSAANEQKLAKVRVDKAGKGRPAA